MPSMKTENRRQAYWRSLGELADSPDFRRFVEAEFPAQAGEMLAPASRRTFLKLMGASAALAGLTSCRWPREEILPFSDRPGGRIPGVPVRYATSMELGGSALGLLVTSFDGRPVKIEGNPDHPESLGAAHSFAQASVLELYDPDRSRVPLRFDQGREISQSDEDLRVFLRGRFGEASLRGGEGLRVLAAPSSSPTLARLRQRLEGELPGARWHEYEPLSRDNEREGARLAFGRPLRARIGLEGARVILSLGADLLLSDPSAVRLAREYAAGRDETGEMNRLYAVESSLSVTGAAADHRFPLPEAAIPVVAARLLSALVLDRGLALPPGLESLVSGLGAFRDPAEGLSFIEAVADDLAAHPGRSLVSAGRALGPETHALVHLLNAVLGNAGRSVTYYEDPGEERPSQRDSLRELSEAMSAGEVETLILLGGNPVFDAPADLELGKALEGVAHSLHLGLYRNESAQACRWHVPAAHYLESWSDTRAWDGTYGVVQPLIEPLYGGKTAAELLSMGLDEAPAGAHDLVRETFGGLFGEAPAGEGWRRALHDGLVAGSGLPGSEPELSVQALAEALDLVPPLPPALGAEKLELVFTADASVHDGRFANNGWLQELPDPITKLTWDNAALFSPATAEALGIRSGDLVRLTLEERELEVAAYVQPGQATWSVALPLGYGRSAAGRVGDGTGFNAYRLRTTASLDSGLGLKVELTGGRYELASTQNHHAADELGRAETARRLPTLVRELPVEEYRHDPHAVGHMDHHPPLVSLWKEHEFDGHRWGMAIDLNACIGCNACTVACQAENNIPIVGKEQVVVGREMHWIRLDRYFKGDPERPQVVQQPVACQHCELAPCEQVCPVAATQHDREGLNVMVYNRCIGTRYCSNNCPYKVRRFNFFDYHKELAATEKMAFNPEVTVRSRGVMEKCTYCLHRINAAKIEAKNERRPLRDGEITPACAQTCPARAITFGDLSDPESRVSRLRENDRSYALLAEINVKPRTVYLARLRNPAPALDEEESV